MFNFKRFSICQDNCGMKVGTDAVLLGAWATGGRRILDIGTGTGIIALMMAQRFPAAVVEAIDIDAAASIQAEQNVATSPFADRVRVTHSSLQDYVKERQANTECGVGSFDCIVSNPPFFIDSLKNPDRQKAVARHADELPFPVLFESVSKLLTTEGTFSVVLPADVVEEVCAQATFNGLYLMRRCMVKTTPTKLTKRCLLTFCKRRPQLVDQSEECLQDANGGRSLWYGRLTEEFYL